MMSAQPVLLPWSWGHSSVTCDKLHSYNAAPLRIRLERHLLVTYNENFLGIVLIYAVMRLLPIDHGDMYL